MPKLSRLKESLRSRPGLDLAFFVAALVTAPFVLRAALLFELGASPGLADLRGFLTDAAVAIAFSIPVAALQRLPFRTAWRIFGGQLLILWAGINIGNFEHVLALGTMVNWDYIGFLADGTFLKGSVAHIGHPVIYGVVFMLPIPLYILGTRSVVRNRKHMIALPGFAVLCMAGMFAWPIHSDAATWRQRNFLPENFRWIGSTAETLTATQEDIPGLYPAGLEGEPIMELGHGKTNVLLVVLEGISGAYLDSVAEVQGVEGQRPRLPQLDARARTGISAVNFFNHQRQTNRGLYCVHCGDLPKQGTYAPKMSERGMGTGKVNCLPAVLGRKGYETVFIQAAPLGFMGKDKFMPRAGFDELHGSEWFKRAEGMGQWGMDDLSLFKKAVGRIEELRQGDKPWLVSILTAGTHHPFTVPEDFKSKNESGSFAHAVDFLDKALEYLFGYLETSGVLDDTLVVFTSDESFGIEGTADSDSMMLAQAFGTFTALTPQKVKQSVEEPFAQLDVAVSILDYLGYTDELKGIGGRSIFRRYAEPRAIPFANTYMRMVGALGPDDNLYTCYEDFSKCRKYEVDRGHVFSADRAAAEVGTDEIDFIKRMDARSLFVPDSAKEGHWQLIDTGKDIEVAQIAKGERVDVFSNQYLSVHPGQVVDVDIAFEIKGDENARLKLRHGLYAMPKEDMPTGIDYAHYRSSEEEREKLGIKGESTLGMRPRFVEGTKRLHRVTKEMQPGQVFRTRYSFGVTEVMERLSCAVFVWFNEGSSSVEMRFSAASLDIRKKGEGDKKGKKMKLFEWGFPGSLSTK